MDDTQVNMATINLEKLLSPIWKMTFYLGVTFDWCRKVPNQSRISIALRFFIIFLLFFFLLAVLVANVDEINYTLRDTDRSLFFICLIVSNLIDQPLILYVWFTFLIYRKNLQAFFYDWGLMEEQQFPFNKGVDVRIIKRTCIIVYVTYLVNGTIYFAYFIPILFRQFHVVVENYEEIFIFDDYAYSITNYYMCSGSGLKNLVTCFSS